MSAEMEEKIKGIQQDVALHSSTSIEMPVLVDVRLRLREHGGRAVKMEGMEKKELRKGEGNTREKGKKSMIARLLDE